MKKIIILLIGGILFLVSFASAAHLDLDVNLTAYYSFDYKYEYQETPNVYGTDGANWINPLNLFDGNWHQVVVTRAGTLVKFYLDGAQTGTDKTLGSNNSLSINRIGNRNGAFYYAGKMSDVRIYEGLLSVAEISQLFTNEEHKYLL